MDYKCYVIAYKNPTDSKALIASIKNYGTWARMMDNTWAIVTTQSASEVRDNLKRFFPETGRLFVIKSGIESAWKNVECSGEWLKKNL